MSLTFLVGGARSGKSARAVELARASNAPVTVIATAEAGDDEMRERIRAHRGARPSEWHVVEEPIDLATSLSRAGGDHAVVLDCLSLWAANVLERGWTPMEIDAASSNAVSRACAREALTIVVSNEVGLGVVPRSELGRRYRDVLGRVNAQWAAAADEAFFVVAGRALRLE